ncbi:ATP-binding protein [Thalassobaculum sp. OXR-137]|uniref:sensor histidine kinase n=1 Tax=Thalassobaculum sp. OXR-137 TaxID=3100173 RepID=UPI002AC8B3AA|nr:ATP-binding protein [Thalassobaculum sp. OXR-137]WPZ35297.1 ATP-binding protein [Thalassobaculum sp. OXR-137]
MTAAGQNRERSTEPSPSTRSTVTGRLFRTAFFLYLAAAIAITGALVAETYLCARADLERELSIHRRALERTLSGPLWSLDRDEIAEIAAATAGLPEIVGIVIRDHNRTGEFARAGDVPDQPSAEAEPRDRPGDGIALSFPVDYSHAVGQTRVGFVTLFTSEMVVLERVRWHIALLVLAALLKTAILWFIFKRVGRSILVRPLAALVDATRRTGFDKLEPVEFDAATARAAAGTEIETLRSTFNDMIGQLRRSRDALSVLNTELEARVGERTRELEARTAEASAATARVEQARRQAAAALEEAERAARAKAEFLALVGHELRTPLNSVLGFSELIQRQVSTRQDDVNPAQIASYAGSIHESGTQLLTLITDILDLSRIEAGRMEVTPEWIDTAATTRTVVEMMRDPATKRRLSLECLVKPDLPMLKVDPRRYRQMLMNLLSNALKYTEPGGEIRIDGYRRPDGWLEIVVADTGVGMPASDIAIALEPFGRAGDPTTRRLAGAGLGLPLVARMMQLHGGRLAIESAINAGTRVMLRFPPNSVRDE